MTARSTRYPPAGYQVRIPSGIWTAALDEVRRYSSLRSQEGKRGSEGLVYFGGVPSTHAVVVTSLYRLSHSPQGDCVKPTSDEVRWLLSTLRQRDEKLVAQLHTHRHSAHHSAGDNAMATSFHDGFMSIVAPGFAVNVDEIAQCIVHEYQSGNFRTLSLEETNQRFIVQPQIADRSHDRIKEEANKWRRYVQRLRSIARRRR